MDIAGAVVLSQRLAQQEQWRSARAVRLGVQPAVDPDGHALESFRGDIRYYGSEERIEVVGGSSTLVTRRVCKRLVDGSWRDDVVVERVQHVA